MRVIHVLVLLAWLVLVASQVLPQRVIVDVGPTVPAESWPLAADHRH